MSDIPTRFAAQIEELSDVSRRLGDLGYATSHGGNISYRVDEDIVLITPTKLPKRLVKAADVCAVDLAGKTLYAPTGRKPTGETPIHVGLFRRRPDVNAILHAHPPVLTGFACSDRAALLSRPILPEPIVEVGPAAVCEYAEPLTEELAQTFVPHVETHNFFLMKNHGCLVMSRQGLDRGLDYLLLWEKFATSILVAEALGGVKEISRADVDNLNRTCKTRSECLAGKPGAVSSLLELYYP